MGGFVEVVLVSGALGVSIELTHTTPRSLLLHPFLSFLALWIPTISNYKRNNEH